MFDVVLGTDAFNLCVIAGAGGVDGALLADLKVSLWVTLFIAVDGDRVTVKCRKFTEGTLGTPDVKSGPTRCRKGLRLQLMCCTPFRLLSQDFRTGRLEIGDRKIRVKIRVVLRVETRGRIIKVRTYSIFKLNYLHDMSEVFMLSIGINKKINQKTRNKQNP